MAFGNPGVGKSTLLNTLTNTSAFASGPSLCGGLTSEAQSLTIGDTTYIDTPGLDDVLYGELAAEVLSRILSVRQMVKCVFVTTLSAGHARAADVLALRVVLDALTIAGVRNVCDGYVVWVNKASAAEARALIDTGGSLRTSVLQAFGYRGCMPEMKVIPQVKLAVGKANRQLGDLIREEMLDWLSKTPTLHLTAQVPVVVMPIASKRRRKSEQTVQLYHNVVRRRPQTMTIIMVAIALAAAAAIMSMRSPSARYVIKWIISSATRSIRARRVSSRVRPSPTAL